jgi:threonine dehydrogenase-like Zn-dependent dehydrogenase
MKTVKAAVMLKPGKIEIQEFPYPKGIRNGLIVKMELSGIYGTDKQTYLGQSKQYAEAPAETDTPHRNNLKVSFL